MSKRQNEINPPNTTYKIASFRAQYDFLSNFYNRPITYKGLIYDNNEAAFQAQKCITEEEKANFCNCSPSKAKSRGRSVKLRSDWESIKIGVMEDVVYLKFTQHPDLAARLLATGETELVEGNTWGDCFWGFDTRTQQGQNHLGKILMQVRSQLRQEK